MKNKLLLITFFILTDLYVFAQAPQSINYQAVIRNSAGNILDSQIVNIQFIIHDSTPNGRIVYSEQNQSITNGKGLVNLSIGKGQSLQGMFSHIKWAVNEKYLQTRIDVLGGNNFVDIGTSQLLSVPYALYANNGLPDGSNNGDILYWNGNQWVKVNQGLPGQFLQLGVSNIPKWSGIPYPTVETENVSNITASNVQLNGNIISDGGSGLLSGGFCYSTSQNPTINNNIVAAAVQGQGMFTVLLNGLMPVTTYYVKAFATNSVGTNYGHELSFTTRADIPSVSTLPVFSITGYSAIGSGVLIYSGGDSVTEKGICWSTHPNPLIDSDQVNSNVSGNYSFAGNVVNLNPNTQYYLRAFAKNNIGVGYGNEVQFTTLRLPQISGQLLDSVSWRNAFLHAVVSDSGSAAVISRGFCYDTLPNPGINNSFVYANGNSLGDFTAELTSLRPSTTYHYRSFVTSAVGTAYGEDNIFTTAALTIPVVNTSLINTILPYSSIGGGEVTNHGGLPVTSRGVCWSTNANPTIALNTKTTDGSGIGNFNSNLSSLLPGTLYYVRAYASNDIGTAYGNEVSFITDSVLAEINTSNVSNIDTSSAQSGGSIIKSGGTNIYDKGICWSINANPTIQNDFHTSSGSGLNDFNGTISNLIPGTVYHVRAYATNGRGTAYGNEVVFVTDSTIPTIYTFNIDSITHQSAISGGNIFFDGGARITQKGLCWSTSQQPTVLLSTKTIEGIGSGSFNSTINNLQPVTTYYVRAYATNSKGTAYGNEMVFTTDSTSPTISTAAVSSITYNYALSGGMVSSNGGAVVTAKGICWSTSVNPTVDLTTKTINTSGSVSFTDTIKNLLPNTIYHVRAYAVNSKGISYGNDLTFTSDSTTPTISTVAISNLTSSSASSGGNISSNGGAVITTKGICWSTSINPTVALSTKTTITGTGSGNFSSNLSGLTPATLYHVRAYATNSKGTAYGNDITFTSDSTTATISTTSITSITSNTAASGGSISTNGGAVVTVRGICWSTTANPTTSSTTKTINNSGSNNFSDTLKNLTPATLYHVRAYATNSKGTAYGNDLSFTSDSSVPVISTVAPVNVTDVSATVGGNITTNNGAVITVKGICWSTSANPTIALSTKTAITGTGSANFTSNITGLAPVTTYHVRAYATNSKGTSYGEDITFTTTIGLPVIITGGYQNVNCQSTTHCSSLSSDGGSSITQRGLCWNVYGNNLPTTSSNVVLGVASGSSQQCLTISGLSIGGIYNVRAFATNAAGTSYGENWVVYTNTYYDLIPETTIGTQTWQTKNIAVSTYRNGDPIPQVTSATEWMNLTTGAWCWYNNDSVHFSYYGKLYNWYAVNDPRGLAPVGWHVPTHNEYLTLLNSVGGDASTAGYHLKNRNDGGDGTTAFNAYMSGWRAYSDGTFGNAGFSCWLWTQSNASSYPNYRTFWHMYYSHGYFWFDSQSQKLGIPVRLIRDF